MLPGVPGFTPGVSRASWTAASVQRQLDHLLAVDDGADRGVLGLQQEGAGVDVDVFGGPPDGQADGPHRHYRRAGQLG